MRIFLTLGLGYEPILFGASVLQVSIFASTLFLIGGLIMKPLTNILFSITRMDKFWSFALNRTINSTIHTSLIGDDKYWNIFAASELPQHMVRADVNFVKIEDRVMGGVKAGSLVNIHDEFYRMFIESSLDIGGEKRPHNRGDIDSKMEKLMTTLLYHNAYFRDENVVHTLATKIAT